MKKTTLLVLLAIVLLLFTACSEKDDNTTTPNTPNPPAMATIADNTLTMPAEDTVFADSLLTDCDYMGALTPSIPLAHFISHEMTNELVGNTGSDETQKLFAYHLIASDDFTPRDRGYNDLTWDKFKTGVLLPQKSFRSYFVSDSIETAFDVKHLQTIKMYRAVQVIKIDASVVLFEMNILPTYQVANYDSLMEDAFKLKDFINEFVTTTPAEYDYVLSDNTGYEKTFTWANIQDGYWLKDTKKTIFPSFPDMPNSQRKFKKLMSIQLIPKA